MPTQTDYGKAFEFSVANNYSNCLQDAGLAVNLIKDAAFLVAQAKYGIFSYSDQRRFDVAASATVETLLKLEPGFSNPQSNQDILSIQILPDSAGQAGDVRDIVFRRIKGRAPWEVGISAKNNHDAVKHSRLSPKIDFGKEWIGTPCSLRYFSDVRVVFDWIASLIAANPQQSWASLGNAKEQDVYKPVLLAFRDEMSRLLLQNPQLPQLLLKYLIGRYPFYKVIKDDTNNCVAVKGFNLNGGLNRSYNGFAPSHRIDSISFPTRIIEFDFVPGSNTTLKMYLDHGWQISFRIHNASTKLETSLKFDINLIGNPPVLFTQHLFV